MEHLLITYSYECAKKGHIDPNFTELIYGDNGLKGEIIKKRAKLGSIIFFNTRIDNNRYITAYFCVEKLLINGIDNGEIDKLKCDAKNDDVIVIGDRDNSKILTAPLLFDKKLIQKITSYNATDEYFNSKSSELEAIKDKTLNPKVITEVEKQLLIKLCKNRG